MAEDPKRGFVIRYELLSIILIMVLQLLGGMWWASSTNTNLINMKAELVSIKAQLEQATRDRFTGLDAERAHAAIEKRLDKIDSRVETLERKN